MLLQQTPILRTWLVMTMHTEQKLTLTEKIEWRKTLWIFGFVKTTISTSLISTGVVLLFNGITNHPLFDGVNEIAIIVGFLMILGAVITIITIDRYKEKKKKTELETIEKHIDEKAKFIAEEKILEYMKKLEN